MLIHLLQLLSLFLLLGIILPIVLWAIKKDQEPLVNKHGKIVINWLITELIYTSIGFILFFSTLLASLIVGSNTTDISSFILVDIIHIFAFFDVLLIFMVVIAGFVFPIIGGIRANNGIVWKYPFSIQFFK
jgi:uncharacterized Tic20 family protein